MPSQVEGGRASPQSTSSSSSSSSSLSSSRRTPVCEIPPPWNGASPLKSLSIRDFKEDKTDKDDRVVSAANSEPKLAARTVSRSSATNGADYYDDSSADGECGANECIDEEGGAATKFERRAEINGNSDTRVISIKLLAKEEEVTASSADNSYSVDSPARAKALSHADPSPIDALEAALPEPKSSNDPASDASADSASADSASNDFASADSASADLASADLASADLASADPSSADPASADPAAPRLTQEKEDNSPLFSPPLYRQRYYFVRDILLQHEAKSVVDFGCAEPKLLSFLKFTHQFESLVGVDLLRLELEQGQDELRPQPGDYLDRRKSPLTISLFCGSMLEIDDRLANRCDAVTLVEVVEHLEDPVLKRMPEVVFGLYRPRIAVMTTPNSEFNVVFGPDFSGFRHWDHKFEWTREEFEEWSRGVGERFGYDVQFYGIGDVPEKLRKSGIRSEEKAEEEVPEKLRMDPGSGSVEVERATETNVESTTAELKKGPGSGIEVEAERETLSTEMTAESRTGVFKDESTAENLRAGSRIMDVTETKEAAAAEVTASTGAERNGAGKWGDVGKCSQAAVFVRRASLTNDASEEKVKSSNDLSSRDLTSKKVVDSEQSQNCDQNNRSHLPKSCDQATIRSSFPLSTSSVTSSTASKTHDDATDTQLKTSPIPVLILATDVTSSDPQLTTSLLPVSPSASATDTISTDVTSSDTQLPTSLLRVTPHPSEPASNQPLELFCEFVFPCAEIVDVETEKETQLQYYVHRMARDAFDRLEIKYWRCADGEQFEDLEELVDLPPFLASGGDWPPEEVEVALEDLRKYSKLEALFPLVLKEVEEEEEEKEKSKQNSISDDKPPFRRDSLVLEEVSKLEKVEEVVMKREVVEQEVVVVVVRKLVQVVEEPDEAESDFRNSMLNLNSDKLSFRRDALTEKVAQMCVDNPRWRLDEDRKRLWVKMTEEEEEEEEDDYEWTQGAEDDNFTYERNCGGNSDWGDEDWDVNDDVDDKADDDLDDDSDANDNCADTEETAEPEAVIIQSTENWEDEIVETKPKSLSKEEEEEAMDYDQRTNRNARFYWEYLPSKKELAIPTELSDSFSAEYSAGLRLPFGVDDSGVEERVLWREFPPDVVDGQFDDAEDDYSQPLVISLGNLYL